MVCFEKFLRKYKGANFTMFTGSGLQSTFLHNNSNLQTQCRPAFVLLTDVIHTQIYLYIRDVKNLVQALKENDFVMRWDGQRRVRSERKLH
jgi:hypothetical protein